MSATGYVLWDEPGKRVVVGFGFYEINTLWLIDRNAIDDQRQSQNGV